MHVAGSHRNDVNPVIDIELTGDTVRDGQHCSVATKAHGVTPTSSEAGLRWGGGPLVDHVRGGSGWLLTPPGVDSLEVVRQVHVATTALVIGPHLLTEIGKVQGDTQPLLRSARRHDRSLRRPPRDLG